jgi:co-chaperonin GroES (HSP10)
MPYMLMDHEIDPREKLLKDIGDLSDVEILNNKLLLAVYLRPERTKSGFLLPSSNLDEDKFQSKVGLLVKMGASACEDKSGAWFKGIEIKMHDWLVSRPSDGWSITINGVLCRIIEDSLIEGRVQHPDQAW